jgi:hypothetical protein
LYEQHRPGRLIYATGFEVGADYTHTIGFQLYGRGGRSLGDKWKQGAETMHSMFTRGFRNRSVMSTMQSGQGANFQHMLVPLPRRGIPTRFWWSMRRMGGTVGPAE